MTISDADPTRLDPAYERGAVRRPRITPKDDRPLIALAPPIAISNVDSATATFDESFLERPTDVGPVAARLLREKIQKRLLGAADVLATTAVTLLASWLVGASLGWAFLLVPLVVVATAKVEGLYDRDDQVIQKSTLFEWRRLSLIALLAAVTTRLLWQPGPNSADVYRLRVVLLLTLGYLVAMVLARVLARAIAIRVSPSERCGIVGSPEECERLASDLSEVRGVEVIGVVSNAGFSASVADVRAVVERLDIQRMIIGPYAPWREGHILELVRTLKWLGVRVTIMPSIMAVVGGATIIDDLNGTVLLGVPSFGMTRSSAAVKRGFDLCVGLLVALVVAVPAMLLALWIRLDSPGPIIFKQTRIGRGGKPFTMYKFRSMVVDAEQLKAGLEDRNEATNGLFKMDADPRVTRVGRLIRKTYLDELPQLINILRGEMSLVGPRPLIRTEDILLTGSDRHRLVLVPGMTGPWQLRGPVDASLTELAKLDYLYASNWSIWRDVDIIIGTVARVLRQHGR